MKPLISVIVPIYKVEKYLRKCVDSICNQTYENLEIILVDDGSPDTSGKIADELSEKDSRIKVIHKQNGGLSSARNAGLDVATGEYVAFVDSDDCIKPEMYEILYGRAISEDADISAGGMASVKDGVMQTAFNPVFDEKMTFTSEEAERELIRNIRITNSMCDKLFKKEIFSDLRMREGIIYEDMQLQPFCVAKANRITYTSEPFYCYNVTEGSILRSGYSIRHYQVIENSRERLDFLRKNYPSVYPEALAMHMAYCIEAIFRSRGESEWDEKRRELIRYVKNPDDKSGLGLLSRNVRIKRTLLKIHPALFMFVMRLTGRK